MHPSAVSASERDNAEDRSDGCTGANLRLGYKKKLTLKANNAEDETEKYLSLKGSL